MRSSRIRKEEGWVSREWRALASMLALGAAQLAGAPPVGARQSPAIDREAVAELGRSTVLSLYERWGDVLRRSGVEVTVQASSFRTVWPDEFAGTLLREVVTVVPEKRLVISKATYDDPTHRTLGVSYLAEWQAVTEDQVEPEVRTWNPSVRDALAEDNKLGPPSSGEVAAIATFEVVLGALGQSTSYRALLLWHRLPAGQDSGSYLLNDPVAQRIEEVAGETHHVAPPDVLRDEMRDHLRHESQRLGDAAGLSDSPECIVDSENFDYPLASASDSYEHNSGSHSSSSIFGFICSCDSRCTSTSQPAFRYRSCLESGNLYRVLRFHETRSDYQFTSGLVVDGHTRGAPAAGTSACYVQSCSLVGGCSGGNIQFSPGEGGRIQANFTGNQIWDGQLDFVGECGRCTAQQPERMPRGHGGRGPFIPADEPPLGTGGDWSGADCWWHCTPQTFEGSACNPHPSPCTFESCDLICSF